MVVMVGWCVIGDDDDDDDDDCIFRAYVTTLGGNEVVGRLLRM